MTGQERGARLQGPGSKPLGTRACMQRMPGCHGRRGTSLSANSFQAPMWRHLAAQSRRVPGRNQCSAPRQQHTAWVRSIRTRLPACYLRARLLPGRMGRAAPSAAHVEPAQARQSTRLQLSTMCGAHAQTRRRGRSAPARALEGHHEQQLQLRNWEKRGRSTPRREVERPYSRQAAARSNTQPRRAIAAFSSNSPTLALGNLSEG